MTLPFSKKEQMLRSAKICHTLFKAFIVLKFFATPRINSMKSNNMKCLPAASRPSMQIRIGSPSLDLNFAQSAPIIQNLQQVCKQRVVKSNFSTEAYPSRSQSMFQTLSYQSYKELIGEKKQGVEPYPNRSFINRFYAIFVKP